MLHSKFIVLAFVILNSLNFQTGSNDHVKEKISTPVVIKYAFMPKDNVLVCISKTSHRYHLGMCKGMKACTHEKKWVTKSQAQSTGKTLCGFCAKGQYD